ncbi:CinA family protein [Nocardioides donggukensis]|uniref:CinA family protein n=1 Tax=Nocardioides donggukensis TaxID=2774019 RepID=A0A927K651_9ACTN|nr:CinA family protein [Nocardioides donggukensis]MBD8869840.1 CinA family protein [Nocardioides donggukensis]
MTPAEPDEPAEFDEPSTPEGRAATVLAAVAARGGTLATAESLTGGLLGATLTAVPGASEVYVGGVVAYATRLKVTLLGVPEEVIARHGVVSGECVSAMARGVAARTGAEWGLATSGVAGPGEQDGVPAGTVWVAAAGPTGVAVRRHDLPGDRARVRRAACLAALDLVMEMAPTA